MGLISRVSSRTYRSKNFNKNFFVKKMAPTKYGDLAKSANDLFDKNYEHGKYSLEVKSKANNFEFTSKGHQNNLDGSIKSSHETTMQLCKLGKLKETFTPGSDKIDFDLENKSLVKDVKLN